MKRLLLFLLLLFLVSRVRVAEDGTVDVSGLTFNFPGDDLAAQLIPHLVNMLSTNQTLQNALVNAIMPQVRAQMATIARATGGSGATTPRSGPTPV